MILITGGLGYIGSHVNKLLSSRGYSTLVLDNLVSGSRAACKWGDFVECDLEDKDKLREICVGKFIFSSTAAVYGAPLSIPIKESHPLNPINPYGESKVRVEEELSK